MCIPLAMDIQNYAARVILRLPKSSSIATHLKSLHWLSVNVRSTYKIACLCHHCHSSTAPSYVADMLQKKPSHTRNTRSSSYTMPLLNRPAHIMKLLEQWCKLEEIHFAITHKSFSYDKLDNWIHVLSDILAEGHCKNNNYMCHQSYMTCYHCHLLVALSAITSFIHYATRFECHQIKNDLAQSFFKWELISNMVQFMSDHCPFLRYHARKTISSLLSIPFTSSVIAEQIVNKCIEEALHPANYLQSLEHRHLLCALLSHQSSEGINIDVFGLIAPYLSVMMHQCCHCSQLGQAGGDAFVNNNRNLGSNKSSIDVECGVSCSTLPNETARNEVRCSVLYGDKRDKVYTVTPAESPSFLMPRLNHCPIGSSACWIGCVESDVNNVGLLAPLYVQEIKGVVREDIIDRCLPDVSSVAVCEAGEGSSHCCATMLLSGRNCRFGHVYYVFLCVVQKIAKLATQAQRVMCPQLQSIFESLMISLIRRHAPFLTSTDLQTGVKLLIDRKFLDILYTSFNYSQLRTSHLRNKAFLAIATEFVKTLSKVLCWSIYAQNVFIGGIDEVLCQTKGHDELCFIDLKDITKRTSHGFLTLFVGVIIKSCAISLKYGCGTEGGVVEYEFCYRVLETMHNNVKFYYPPTKLLGSFSHDYFYWLPQVCGENDDVWFDALLCLLDIYRIACCAWDWTLCASNCSSCELCDVSQASNIPHSSAVFVYNCNKRKDLMETGDCLESQIGSNDHWSGIETEDSLVCRMDCLSDTHHTCLVIDGPSTPDPHKGRFVDATELEDKSFGLNLLSSYSDSDDSASADGSNIEIACHISDTYHAFCNAFFDGCSKFHKSCMNGHDNNCFCVEDLYRENFQCVHCQINTNNCKSATTCDSILTDRESKGANFGDLSRMCGDVTQPIVFNVKKPLLLQTCGKILRRSQDLDGRCLYGHKNADCYERVMFVLRDLSQRIEKLHRNDQFPYNPDPLLRLISQVI